MKRLHVALLVAASLASPAFASDAGKIYLGADFGRAMFTPASELSNPNSVHIAGGYYFTPSWAAEVGYTRFGDSTANLASGVVTSSFSSYHAVGLYIYPLNPDIDFMAKIGLTNNRSTTSATGSVIVITPSISKTSVMYGIGAQYHLNQTMDIRAQYEIYGDLADNSTTTLANTSLGIVYKF